MRKRLLIATAALVVLAIVAAPFALFLWPVHHLRLGVSAGRRVDADLVDGYPAAVAKTEGTRLRMFRENQELTRARYSWQEVRCSIEDYSAQLAVAEFAQVCTLRTVWLVPVPRSRWDDCAVALPFVRARSWMFSPEYDGATRCPVVGPESREGDRSVLVSGHRPTSLGADQTWEVVDIEVDLSTTMIGCRPALPFCRSTFSHPRMDAVAGLRRS